MALRTSNNTKKIVAAPALATDTEITLVDTLGLPDLTDPTDWTMLTFIRLSDMQQEIVQVDDIVGNVLTVQRGKENTIALDLVGGDECRNFFTSGMFQSLTVGGTVPPASEATAGILEVATQAETDAGTDDERAVSPLKLEARLNAVVIDASETDKGIAELATQAETDAGTDDERIVTPLKLATHLSGLPVPTPILKTAIIREVQSFGTDGGATVAGTTTRVMNETFYDPDGIVTVLGNGHWELAAGKYIMILSTVAYSTGGATLMLIDSGYNGGSEFPLDTVYTGSGSAALRGYHVTTSTGVEDYHLFMKTSAAQAGNGRGRATNFGSQDEVYSTVTIIRIGD